MNVVLTSYTGDNSDLLPKAFALYVPEGATVADVTYGKGVFWKGIDKTRYNVLESDLLTGVDFRALPYEDQSIDVLILDPPYMHGGATVKDSINKCYRNQNTSHESVIRLYAAGILEACRVLRKKGLILVKCQDEIESAQQCLSHCEIIDLLKLFGFSIVDFFILTQKSTPAMRNDYQKSARKNHSYLIVAQFRR